MHYFTRYFGRGTDWYRQSFQDEDGLDASATYLFDRHAHPRIASTLPSTTQLVVILREPVARLTSHYLYQRERKYEWRSLDEALASELSGFRDLPQRLRGKAEEHFSYLGRSLYGQQLSDLLVHLDAFPLHVCDYHRLFGSDSTELNELRTFLGESDREFTLPNLNQTSGSLPAGQLPPAAWAALRDDAKQLTDSVQRSLSWLT